MASAKHLAIRPEILRPRYPIEYEENSSEYTSLGKAKVKVQSTWQYTPTLQDSWVYCKGLWGSCKTMIPKFHSAPPFLRWDAGAAEIQIPTLYQLLLDRPNLPQTPRVWRNNLMNFKNEDMSAMDPIRFTWNLFSFLDAEASLFPSPIVNDQRFSLLRMQDLKADVSAGHLSLPARQPQTYQRNTSKNIELSDAKSLKKPVNQQTQRSRPSPTKKPCNAAKQMDTQALHTNCWAKPHNLLKIPQATGCSWDVAPSGHAQASCKAHQEGSSLRVHE